MTTATPLRRHTAPPMGRKPSYRHEIAMLRKNSCERVCVSLGEYNGTDLCNLSVVRDGTGNHRIGRMKGTTRFVSIQIAQLRPLIEALQDAKHKAIEEGLLPAETVDVP